MAADGEMRTFLKYLGLPKWDLLVNVRACTSKGNHEDWIRAYSCSQALFVQTSSSFSWLKEYQASRVFAGGASAALLLPDGFFEAALDIGLRGAPDKSALVTDAKLAKLCTCNLMIGWQHCGQYSFISCMSSTIWLKEGYSLHVRVDKGSLLSGLSKRDISDKL